MLAPVLAGGVAVIGDPGLYACAGDARVADVAVEGHGVAVTVLGAGERVHVLGWSRHPVSAVAWSPDLGTTSVDAPHDALTGMWNVALELGAAGWTKLRLQVRVPIT